MSQRADGQILLDPGESRRIESASRALARLPARAPIASVFDAIQPCLPLAAGLFGILRPAAPDSMVTQAARLPPEVLDSWMGTPGEQLARTLAPVIRSPAGGLWRDSETVTGALREQLEVLRRLDAAGLGEGAGYKVLERASAWHGPEHFMLAMIMERGEPVPPRSRALLAALNPAIAAAILRVGLPLLESEPILTQIVAERSTGYICLSRTGAVLEANRRAHELVVRFRDAARIDTRRGALAEFGGRALERAARGQIWQLQSHAPPSLLEVSAHRLAKETHALPEDVLLLVLHEVRWPEPESGPLDRAGLTPQERKIALLLAHTPASYKEIAADLACSEGTLRKHVENIHRKLRVRSRAELAVLLKR